MFASFLARQVVRDVKELRRAVASKTGSEVVELAAGVAFVLTDESCVRSFANKIRTFCASLRLLVCIQPLRLLAVVAYQVLCIALLLASMLQYLELI